jgi:hypothetical protein
MATTTDVVRDDSIWARYRRHGYFFREAALLTIAMGMALHLYRIIFGDELALQYAVTTTTDKVLMVPMAYAAITGLVVWRRVRFANKFHRAFFTASVAYLTLSVPLHVYCSFVLEDVSFFVAFFHVWFSYLLVCLVYPAFLTMFWRLRLKS